MSVDLPETPDETEAWSDLAEYADLLQTLARDEDSHFQKQARTLLRELRQRGEL
jgi:hypothetical protein